MWLTTGPTSANRGVGGGGGGAAAGIEQGAIDEALDSGNPAQSLKKLLQSAHVTASNSTQSPGCYIQWNSGDESYLYNNACWAKALWVHGYTKALKFANCKDSDSSVSCMHVHSS